MQSHPHRLGCELRGTDDPHRDDWCRSAVADCGRAAATDCNTSFAHRRRPTTEERRDAVVNPSQSASSAAAASSSSSSVGDDPQTSSSLPRGSARPHKYLRPEWRCGPDRVGPVRPVGWSRPDSVIRFVLPLSRSCPSRSAMRADDVGASSTRRDAVRSGRRRN